MVVSRWITWFGCAVLVAALGCGESGETSQATQESHIKRLAILYGRYMSQHRGAPPRNEADFRKFIELSGPDQLKHLGIASVDELFVSERDGQPYVIVYGKLGPPVQGLGGPITMYEQVGGDGSRFVATDLTVETVTEEDFRRMVPNAK
jgi:hypothetical protein